MELRTALKISVGVHGALALWAIVAGWVSGDFDEAMAVREVTLISGAEFAALVEQSGSGAPALEREAPAAVPEAEPAPEAEPDPAPEPVAEPAPETRPEPAPEAAPEPAAPAPPPEPTEALELDPEPGETPTPAPRVAPVPAERPEPDVAEAPRVQEATEPEEAEAAPAPEERLQPTAPEEATTRIVTEATEEGGAQQIALAPAAAQRPRTRPDRPAPEPAPQPVSQPAPEPEPEPEPAPEPETETAAIEDAIAGALSAVEAGGGAAAGDPGPPMNAGERDALRLAVQRCWNVDTGGRSANVTVTVGLSMNPDGSVVNNEVRMLASSGGDEAAVSTAFGAARRAVLRCQPYDLPAEKYAHWQEIEMVFNPSEMRLR